MGGFSLKALETMVESGTEVFKVAGEMGKEGIRQVGDNVGKEIEEHGKTKRCNIEAGVTKEKNLQDYNIGKISTVLSNSVEIVNCLINAYHVIDGGRDSKKSLNLEEKRIENERIQQLETHKQKMRSLENDFAVEMRKLDDNEEEMKRMWEVRSENVKILQECRKYLDIVLNEMMKLDGNDMKKRMLCMENYEKINKLILEQSQILASWDISK